MHDKHLRSAGRSKTFRQLYDYAISTIEPVTVIGDIDAQNAIYESMGDVSDGYMLIWGNMMTVSPELRGKVKVLADALAVTAPLYYGTDVEDVAVAVASEFKGFPQLMVIALTRLLTPDHMQDIMRGQSTDE